MNYIFLFAPVFLVLLLVALVLGTKKDLLKGNDPQDWSKKSLFLKLIGPWLPVLLIVYGIVGFLFAAFSDEAYIKQHLDLFAFFDFGNSYVLGQASKCKTLGNYFCSPEFFFLGPTIAIIIGSYMLYLFLKSRRKNTK